ncbi:MAG: hypothetical protein JWL73_1850 [Actinomycetia bacterium]|nr:hypothetical protein [Actinomycetes bacterium]
MQPMRPEPPTAGDERAMLIGFLEYHRATLASKCMGLTDAQLRARAVEPSNLSLLGLVRHLAEVERGWFRAGLDHEDVADLWVSPDDPDADFDRVDTADVAEAFAAWDEEYLRARAIVDATDSLDTTFEHPRLGQVSLRWVLLHMVEEYSRHNGHADLLRERLDGSTGE